jgi:membrane-associated protease RseP (regulator of RpoE activity)
VIGKGFTLVAIVSLMTLAVTGRYAAAAAPDWDQILGPAQGQAPAPLDKVIWRPDLPAALAEARAQNRPVFVTLRCLPCKQCSAFDKDVLEGGPDLDPLLRQFVTVRLTSAKDVDLRLLPMEGFQDFDLSWWGYFLSPDGRVYGVFGGRDEVSDETRISKPALINVLRRVLAHHHDPRRAAWDVDGPAPAIAHAPLTPTQLPGYPTWVKGHKFDKQTAAAGCLHCHQVAEVLRQPALDAGMFDKAKDFDVWPLPENVGLKLDRDDGLRVTGVIENSPAAAAGLCAGDELAAAGDRRLFGQTDFRGVLHRGPAGTGEIPVRYVRDGMPAATTLRVKDGWRKTVLDWRMSVSQGNVGADLGFWPLAGNKADRKKLGVPDDRLFVRVYAPRADVKAAGLTDKMWVTAIDGQQPAAFGRGLLVWFRLRHEVGDPVTFTVVDAAGTTREIRYKTTKWTE